MKDLQRFEKKLKTDPDNFNLINDKGTTLCALGRLEEGIICFDKVNELNPNDLEATFNKGNALSELKKYDEAMICFQRCMLFDSKSSVTHYSSLLAHAYNGKGFALAKKEDFSRAIICFNIAITVDKNYSAAKYNDALSIFDQLIKYDFNKKNYHFIKGILKNHEEFNKIR